jgi:hypothetical protein
MTLPLGQALTQALGLIFPLSARIGLLLGRGLEFVVLVGRPAFIMVFLE